MHSHYDLNTRRACRLVKQTRSVQYYCSVKDPRNDLRARMRELAQVRVRYGYRRVHVLLKREGWSLGKNQMYRDSTARRRCSSARNCRSAARWWFRGVSGIERLRRTRSGAWISCQTSSPTACVSARSR